MKILVIPDIHGSTYWKKNYLENRDKADAAVFLGDYVDSFNLIEKGENAAKNLEDIFRTTKDDKNCHILLGNHDAAYCLFAKGDPRVSGHQQYMETRYNNIFEENADRIKIAVELDGWVLSHAGISKSWYEDYCKYYYENFFGKEAPESPVGACNEMWRMKNLSLLDYNDNDWSGYGNSKWQTPLWIRPTALIGDMCYPKQIVGHTEIKDSKPLFCKNGESRLVIVDSQRHDTFLLFDTEKEYEYIEQN